jgi:hypothetical protein
MRIVNPFEKFRHPHLDANEGVVFSRQLQQVSARVNRHVYPALRARMLIPSQPDGGDPIATTYNYHDININGLPAAGSARTNTVPNVDVAMTENESRIREITSGYEFDKLSIQRAARAGVALSAEKAIAARYIIEKEINTVLLAGDTQKNIPGLLTNLSIDADAVDPGAGLGTPTEWTGKTCLEIEADVSKMLRYLFSASNGTYSQFVLALPPDQYGQLATMRIPDTDITLLRYLLDKIPLIEDIIWLAELATSGDSGKAEMLAGARNQDVLHSIIPQEYTEEAPIVQGWTTQVQCSARCGGTIVRQPFAWARRYGI